MAAPKPVSPPSISTTTATNAPASDPISPVSRSGTFPHKTSPAVSTQTPHIDTATPAINDAPVELPADIPNSTLSPADEEDIDREFLGGGESAGKGVREQRAAMLASRSKDPGVIVDVPQDPTAEEVHAAKSADGMTTPGIGGREDGTFGS